MTIDLQQFKIDYQKWVAENEHEFRPGNDKIFKTYPLIESKDVPWAPYTGDPSEQTFTLVASGGLYLKDSQPPFDTESIHGDLGFREIPKTVNQEDLAIAHGHYDPSLAMEDINTIFPIHRFIELEKEGVLGKVPDINYSFSYVNDVETLVTKTAPNFIRQIRAQSVDTLFLVPV